MGEVTPLFIFGMGRSGTTNALRVLNAHPDVMLNGEIPLSVMKQFFVLLDSAGRSYAGDDAACDGWRARKLDYAFESLGYLSKGGRGQLRKIDGARFRGHKLPRGESLFDRYEAHFGGGANQPRYFYCARNPFDCWRSYKAMAWNNHETAASFAAQYLESFMQLAHMQLRAEGRVFVLNLDALIAAPNALDWHRANIFAPLDLDLPDAAAKRIGTFVRAEKSGEIPALAADEKKSIAAQPGMSAVIETMFPMLAASALR